MNSKILVVSSLQENTPPNGYGGTERFVHCLSEALVDLGFEIDVLCKKGSGGGKYNKIEVNTEDLNTNKLIDLVKQKKYVLIHLNTRIETFIEQLKTTDVPVAITLHNNFKTTSKWIPIIKNAPESFYFIVISQSLKERVEKALGANDIFISTNDITNLGFGMNISSYQKHYEKNIQRNYYLYLGLIARYKGVLDLSKAFVRSKEKLKIVGPHDKNTEKGYFQKIIDIVNNNDNIEYLDETKNEWQKIKLIRNAKAILVATGYDPAENDCYEAFGLVMLEANSLGTPVIGYSKGNIKDFVIDGINGYKFSNTRELPDIFKKIDETNLFNSCFEYAKKFDINSVAQKYASFFTEIIQKSSLGNT